MTKNKIFKKWINKNLNNLIKLQWELVEINNINYKFIVYQAIIKDYRLLFRIGDNCSFFKIFFKDKIIFYIEKNNNSLEILENAIVNRTLNFKHNSFINNAWESEFDESFLQEITN